MSFGPSPPALNQRKKINDLRANVFDEPTRNRTLGNRAHTRGAVATRRSMPLRYARRDITTIVTERKAAVRKHYLQNVFLTYWYPWKAASQRDEIALLLGHLE